MEINFSKYVLEKTIVVSDNKDSFGNQFEERKAANSNQIKGETVSQQIIMFSVEIYIYLIRIIFYSYGYVSFNNYLKLCFVDVVKYVFKIIEKCVSNLNVNT